VSAVHIGYNTLESWTVGSTIRRHREARNDGYYSRTWPGEIHTMKFYDSALSQQYISALYNEYHQNIWKNTFSSADYLRLINQLNHLQHQRILPMPVVGWGNRFTFFQPSLEITARFSIAFLLIGIILATYRDDAFSDQTKSMGRGMVIAVLALLAGLIIRQLSNAKKEVGLMLSGVKKQTFLISESVIRATDEVAALAIKFCLSTNPLILMWVINVHLGLLPELRTLQIEKLIKELAKLTEKHAAVVCGDFNIDFKSDEYNNTLEKFKTLKYEDIPLTDSSTGTFKNKKRKIDYIFFRNGKNYHQFFKPSATCEIIKTTEHTDHKALALDFSLSYKG
jgi:hypothetical protein